MEESNIDEEPPSKRLKIQHTDANSICENPSPEPIPIISEATNGSAQNGKENEDATNVLLNEEITLSKVADNLTEELEAEDESSPSSDDYSGDDSDSIENTESDEKSDHKKNKVTVSNVSSSDENDAETKKEPTRPESPEVQVIHTKKSGGRVKKAAHMRRNIKDILKPDQLDEETIAAQREEAARRLRMEGKQQQLRQLQQLQLQQKHLMQQSMMYMSHSQDNIDRVPSVEEMLRNISKTSTSISLVSNEPPEVQPSRSRPNVYDDITILSSDEEVENANKNFSPLPGADRQLFRNFGGTVITSYDREDNNVISLSSEEEGNSRDKSRAVIHDSDDDCVVISPPPPEDLEDDKDEKNLDELNVPDHLGRILINVAHPDGEPDVFLAPQIARIIKPHQIGGIRFLYENVVESVDQFNTSAGFGCILAHSMGLGKTVQAVSFCDAFLRYTLAKTVLVIVPINTIQNWMNEFNQWLPSLKVSAKGKVKKKNNLETTNSAFKSKPNSSKEYTELDLECNGDSLKAVELSGSDFPLNFGDVLNYNDEELDVKSAVEKPCQEEKVEQQSEPEILFRNFEIFVLNETVKTLQTREKIITDWGDNGGVLLIGYEMYRMLSLKKLKRSGRKNAFANSSNLASEKIAQEESLNRIYNYLVNPGPDLVICDEGHRIKNSGASISQALKAIKTKRRVVLTGYPLQNNLMEYWCMVDFVRPNFLGTKVEFSNMFERPIQNGQCADSNVEDKRLMRFRSHVLHSLLEGFVQRRSHLVLKNALPAKQEWVFLLKMSPIQKSLYTSFITYLNEGLETQNVTANPIKAFAVCCKIWNHPDALYNVVRKKQSLLDDLDLDEINTEGGGGRGRNSKKTSTNNESSPTAIPDYFMGYQGPQSTSINSRASTSAFRMLESNSLSLDWAMPLFENYVPELLENGVKFQLLFDILKETVDIGDKLLVFSQSLLSLDLIEMFLSQKFKWKKNTQYFRLDGSTTGMEREKLIKDFNEREGLFLFLVSTRAGSLGINLIGANRVIVLDASWNPCHDCQAVCRVYRYGQQKQCQIYRFVTDLSLEKRIYDRQINKRGMADRVVDEMNPDSHFRSKDVNSFLVLHHEHLEKLQYIKCNVDIDKYSDLVLKRVLSDGKSSNLLTKEPFEHESLLIDQKSQKLSKAEKRLAHRNYEKEKKISNTQSGTPYQRASYAAFYPKTPPPSYSSPSSYPNPYSSFGGRSPYDKPMSFYGRYHYSENASEQSSTDAQMESLRERGICVQHLILKKDGFMSDPAGGPDMYLQAGQKVYVLRSAKGTYLRLENGKIIAVRTATNHLNFTASIPPSQDLTPEQLQMVVYSLVKIPGRSTFGRKKYPIGYPTGHPNPYMSPQHPGYPQHLPTEQPLPPSNFLLQNQSHLQIKNYHNNSGGDVTVWRPESNPNSNSNHSSDGPHGNDSPKSSQTHEGQIIGKANAVHAKSMLAVDNFNYLKNLAGDYEGTTEFQNPFSNFLSDLTLGKRESGDSNHGEQSLPNITATPLEQLLHQSGRQDPQSGIELIPIPPKSGHGQSRASSSSKAMRQQQHEGLYNSWNSPTNPSAQSMDPSFFNDFTITPLAKNSSSPKSVSSSNSISSASANNSNPSLKSTLPWENGSGRFPPFANRIKSNGGKPHERGNIDWLSDDFENPLFAGVTSASNQPSLSPSHYSEQRRLNSQEQGENSASSSGCNSIRALLERRDTSSSYHSSSRLSNSSRRNSFNLDIPSSANMSPVQHTAHNQGGI